ncbi:hypothetical protein SRABI80_04887 [Peribacillus frigoritolerans]|nr:hypothetical protein SRABI80_04887 [Peribacillus frigoritolerans]
MVAAVNEIEGKLTGITSLGDTYSTHFSARFCSGNTFTITPF